MGLWPISDLPANETKFLGVRYLMDCWGTLLKTWPKKIDLLVLMGDLIDGKQPKSSGTGIFTTDLGEQAAMATEVLRPLRERATTCIRVWGTPYHEGYDSSLHALDVDLNVTRTDQVIDLQLGDGVLNIAHHPAGGSALYMGTVADREALWSQIATHSGKVPDARWIVRAHKHSYAKWETQERTMVQTPCWQLATAHAKKINYHRFQPSLGGILMLEDREEPGGYRFRPTLFDTPGLEVLTCASLTSQSRLPSKKSSQTCSKHTEQKG